MNKATQYVLGFAIVEDCRSPVSRVYLVQKARPDWQAGRLNGLGGHIEPGETSLEAMRREADEEAGPAIGKLKWGLVSRMTYNETGADVYVFGAWAPDIGGLSSPTPAQQTEPVFLFTFSPESYAYKHCLPNLHWLIPMVKNHLNGNETGYPKITI